MGHYNDIAAFIGFFVMCALFMMACCQIEQIIKSRKILKYGQAKVGDCLSPKVKK